MPDGQPLEPVLLDASLAETLAAASSLAAGTSAAAPSMEQWAGCMWLAPNNIAVAASRLASEELSIGLAASTAVELSIGLAARTTGRTAARTIAVGMIVHIAAPHIHSLQIAHHSHSLRKSRHKLLHNCLRTWPW